MNIPRFVRRLLLSGMGILATIVLVVVILIGLIQTESGRTWFARGLEWVINDPGHTEIVIGRIHGNLLREFQVSEITVRDKDGIWLTIQALSAIWQPLDLFRRKLTVESLTANQVDLDRSQKAINSNDESRPSLIRLISSIQIELKYYEISKLRIKDSSPDEPSELQASGSIRVAADQPSYFQLEALQKKAKKFKAKVNLKFDPLKDSLHVDATYNEGSGGLLARVLEIEGLPPVNIRVFGSGSLVDWHGNFITTLPGTGSVNAKIELARKDGLSFRMTGEGNYLSKSDVFPWSLINGNFETSLVGSWRPDVDITVESGQIRTRGLKVEGSGRVSLSNQAIDAKIKAELTNSQTYRQWRTDFEVKRMGVDVTLRGSLTNPALEFRTQAADVHSNIFATKNVQMKGKINIDRRSPGKDRTVRISVESLMENVNVKFIDGVEDLIGPRIRWAFEGELREDEKVLVVQKSSMNSENLEMSANGSIFMKSGNADIDIGLNLPKLKNIGDRFGISLKGNGTVKGSVKIKSYGDILDGDLSGDFKGIDLEHPAIRKLVNGDVKARAKFRQWDGILEILEGVLVSDQGNLSVSGQMSSIEDRVDAKYRLKIKNPRVLFETIETPFHASTANFAGVVRGPVMNPDIEGNLSLDRLRVHGWEFDSTLVSYHLSDLNRAPSGNFSFSTNSPAGKANGKSTIRLQEKKLHFGKLQLNLAKTSAKGNAIVSLDDGLVGGELTGQVQAIKPWLRLAGIRGDGKAKIHLTLKAKEKRQGALFKIQAERLKISHPRHPTAMTDTLSLSISLSDLFAHQDAQAELNFKNLRIGDVVFYRGQLSGKGTTQAGEFRISTKGQWYENFTAKTAFRYHRKNSHLAIDLSRLTGTALKQTIRLETPTRFTIDEESIQVDKLLLRIGQGKILVDGSMAQDHMAAKVAVSSFSLSTLSPVVKTKLNGILDGHLELAGSIKEPRGSGQLAIKDIRLTEDKGIPSLAINATGDWRQDHVSLQGSIVGSPKLTARLKARLPLRFDSNRVTFSSRSGDPVSGDISWRGNIAEIWKIFPLDTHQLRGQAELELRLTGTAGMPQLSGSMNLSKARYENIVTGTILDNMAVGMKLDGNRAVIENFSANDGEKGSVHGSGSLAIDPKSNFPFHMTTQLRNFIFGRSDDITGSASGKVTFKGTWVKSKVEGRLTTDSIEVRVLDQLPPEVVELHVIEVNAPSERKQQAKSQPPRFSGPQIDLDLTVDIPRRAFVRGKGIDSEWGGNLRVTGTAAYPIMKGKLSLIRGNVSIVGKSFKLDRGEITIPASEKIQPRLDISASHQSQGLQTNIRVIGPATNPKITLSSVPELPQEEILSRILFKKSASKLTGFEAIQLAAYLADLSGSGTGTDKFLNLARNTLGLDVFRIESTEKKDESSPTLSVGKYVSDEVYLGVKQGITPESSTVGIEVEVTPNISVESSVRKSGAAEAGIKFKLDY